jgi:hypothetical protein
MRAIYIADHLSVRSAYLRKFNNGYLFKNRYSSAFRYWNSCGCSWSGLRTKKMKREAEQGWRSEEIKLSVRNLSWSSPRTRLWYFSFLRSTLDYVSELRSNIYFHHFTCAITVFLISSYSLRFSSTTMNLRKERVKPSFILRVFLFATCETLFLSLFLAE